MTIESQPVRPPPDAAPSVVAQTLRPRAQKRPLALAGLSWRSLRAWVDEHARQGARLPTNYAFLIAAAYFTFAGLYIAVSTRLAQALAGSVERLAQIEELKGVAFVVTTSLALFCWSRFLLDRSRREMRQHDAALRLLDRRALAGTLASSVAHDSNNALAVARANAEILSQVKELKPEDVEAAQDLLDAVKRLIEMMRRLADLGSQARMMTEERFDLVQEVGQSLSRLRKHPKVRNCTVRFTPGSPVELLGYPMLVDEIVTNLVINAADATEGKGLVEVEVTRSPAGPLLSVSDNGPGIPEGLASQIFQPFFTTKPDGTGLGLPSVGFCAEDHHGRVDVLRSSSGGARIDVLLPGLDGPAKGDAPPTRAA
jgi:signal transduction histidine kinase